MTKKEPLNIDMLRHSNSFDQKKIDEAFVSTHIGLVKKIAGSIFHSGKVPPCIEFEDLLSWGVEGLIKARSTFNKQLKTKFSTYAYYRIRGEIFDSVRREWTHRAPAEYQENRQKLQESLSEFVSDAVDSSNESPQVAVDQAIESTTFVRVLSNEISAVVSEKKGMRNPEIEKVDQTYDEIWNEVEELELIEKQIVELFYKKGLKQVEIAKHMNISASKVCRIHMKILDKLKERLTPEGTSLP